MNMSRIQSVIVGAALAAGPFAGTAVADTFMWNNASGGDWENEGNWLQGGVAATRCPGEGDTVTFNGNELKSSYTINVNQDTTVDTFYFFPTAASQPTTVTLDLHGHLFRATTELNVRSDANFAKRSILAVTNGTVRCDLGFGNWNKAGGFNVDRESGNSYECGHLDLCGPLSVKLGGKFQVAGKASTMFVRNGANFDENAEGDLVNAGENSLLVFSGAGSGFCATNHSLAALANSTTIVERAACVVSKNGEVAADTRGAALIIDDARYTVLEAALYATGMRVGYNSKVNSSCQGARFVVRSNAVSVVSPTIYVGYANKATCVTHDNEVHVESGARLECAGITLGSREGSWNNRLFVDDATLVTTNITAGATDNFTTNSLVSVRGRNARIEIRQAAQKTALALQYMSTLRFEVPAEGFANVPISSSNGNFTTKRCSAEDKKDVPNRLVIAADEFAKAHPMTTVTLMSFGADSSTAFAELTENFVYEGKRAGTLRVSDDGRSLLYTTPPARGLMLIFR